MTTLRVAVSSVSASGTVGCCFFLKREAIVRRVTPSTQAAKGASPR